MPEYIEKAQVLGVINVYACNEKIKGQKVSTSLTDHAIEEIKHCYCKNVLLELYTYVDMYLHPTTIEEN